MKLWLWLWSCFHVLLLLYCGVGVTGDKQSSLESKQVSRVVELQDSTFFDHVINSTQSWMVMFYAPWCVHCQALKPEWTEAARTNGEWIGYGAVDCTTQTNLAKRFKVSSYPTVYVFPAGEKTPKSVSKYKGALKSRAISSHAATLLSAKLISRPHDIPTLQSFLTKRTPKHTKVLVFALPRDALAIWQALSQHVAAVADVAYIPKGNDKLESIFNVYRFPTIIVVRPPSLTSSSPYSGIVYRGDLSVTPIKHVITTYHESSQPDGVGAHTETYPRNKDVQYHIDRDRGTGSGTTQTTRGNKGTPHGSRTSTPTPTPSHHSETSRKHDDTEVCGLEPTPACSGDGQEPSSTHADADASTAPAPSTSNSHDDSELCGLEPTPACSGDEHGSEDTTTTTDPDTPSSTSHDSKLCGIEPTPACSGSEESSDHESHSQHDEL